MKMFPTSLLPLERIFSISHEITANPSFADILHSIVVVATELVECEGASIYLSDAATNTLSFAATTYEKLRLLNISVPIDQSVAGAAFTGDSPVIVNDVQQDAQHYHYAKADEMTGFTTRSILAVPLTFREHKIGVIQVLNKKQGPFDEADVDLLVILAAQATITIEIAHSYNQAQEEIARRMKMEEELRHYQDHLEELVKERTAEVHRLVTTDPLTGLFNRGHFMTLGDPVMRRAYLDRRPVSGMMIDIDHFKNINETYGHETGDIVLKRLAGLIQETFLPITTRPDGVHPAQGLAKVKRIVRRLTREELNAYGYSLDDIWAPFDCVSGHPAPRVEPSRLQGVRRNAIDRLRRMAQRPGPFQRLLGKARLASDVLLRR